MNLLHAIQNVRSYYIPRPFDAVSYYRLHHCKWLLDHSTGSYDTGCGQKFALVPDGAPAVHGFNYCPYCGKWPQLREAVKEMPAEKLLGAEEKGR